MKLKKLILISAFTFIITMLLCVSVSAYVYVHKGLKSVPSNIYVSTSFTNDQQTRISSAMNEWNMACFSYNCLVYAGVTNVSSYAVEDNTNTITFLSTSESY